jgi:hypothetical protein
MKRGLITTILTITSLMMVCIFQAQAQEAAQQNSNVLNVNGTIITQDQLKKELAAELKKEAGKSLTDEEMKAKVQKVLEKIIKNELLYQDCQKNGITVSDEDINKKYDTEKGKFASEEEYLSNYGTDSATRKNDIKRDISINRLINQKIASTITIDDKEIEKYYKDNPDSYKNKNIALDSCKDDIKKKLRLEKIADGYNSYYAALRKNAKVETLVAQ